MTSRGLAELLKPVIPHASTDPEARELAVIRIELARRAVYAVGFDRYTLAAERLWLDAGNRPGDIPEPVHVRAAEAKSALTLFPFSKDSDPPLHLTIDKQPFPVMVAGQPAAIGRLQITIEALDGTRAVLMDHRDPSHDPLGGWRKTLAGLITRPMARSAPALNFNAALLARWQSAVRKGERLAFFTGSKGDQSILISVESHFLGAWMPVSYLESPAEMLAASPWRDELAEVPWLAEASGVVTGDAVREAEEDGDE
jgi:hypothetical protein